MTPLQISFDLEDLPRIRGIGTVAGPYELQDGICEFLDALEPETRVTFFTTGELARRRPELLQKLLALGHEIACHGDEHENIAKLSQAEFRRVLERATKSIADACGTTPRGFRAPSFSLPADDRWVFKELVLQGYAYDFSRLSEKRRSSALPFDWVETESGKIASLPLFTLKLPLLPRIRALGGTYFRILPISLLRRALLEVQTAGYVPHIWLHAADFLPAGSRNPIEKLVDNFGSTRTDLKLRELLREFEPAGTLLRAVEKSREIAAARKMG